MQTLPLILAQPKVINYAQEVFIISEFRLSTSKLAVSTRRSSAVALPQWRATSGSASSRDLRGCPAGRARGSDQGSAGHPGRIVSRAHLGNAHHMNAAPSAHEGRRLIMAVFGLSDFDTSAERLSSGGYRFDETDRIKVFAVAEEGSLSFLTSSLLRALATSLPQKGAEAARCTCAGASPSSAAYHPLFGDLCSPVLGNAVHEGDCVPHHGGNAGPGCHESGEVERVHR